MRVEIVPAEGVVVCAERWHRVALGVSAPAPPRFLGGGERRQDYALAAEALRLGLASTRCVNWSVRAEFAAPVGPSVATVVPSNPLRAVVTVIGTMARVHRVATLIGLALVASAAPWGALAHLALCLAILPLSVVLHEVGHVLAFRVIDPNAVGVFIVDRSSSRLQRSSMRKGRLVTVAGPVATMFLIAPAAALGIPEVVTAAVIATGHLASLALPLGDGLQLRKERWRAGA